MTYVDLPPKAAILHALEVPPRKRAATPISRICLRLMRPCLECRRRQLRDPLQRSRRSRTTIARDRFVSRA
jgi:hypothetical protein